MHYVNGEWNLDGCLNMSGRGAADGFSMTVWNGRVTVAWSEGYRVYVKKLEGTEWQCLGG